MRLGSVDICAFPEAHLVICCGIFGRKDSNVYTAYTDFSDPQSIAASLDFCVRISKWTRSRQSPGCFRESGGPLTYQSAGVFDAYQHWAEDECPIADILVRPREAFWQKTLGAHYLLEKLGHSASLRESFWCVKWKIEFQPLVRHPESIYQLHRP